MELSLSQIRKQKILAGSRSIQNLHIRSTSSQSPLSLRRNIAAKLPIIENRASSTLNLHHTNSETSYNYTRDISYRLDTLEKIKSRLDCQDLLLKDVLGLTQETKLVNLPDSLAEVEKLFEDSENFMGDPQLKFVKDLESLKFQISKDQMKRNENIIKEGGLLFRTQNGLIQNHVSNIHEILGKKMHKNKETQKAFSQRTDLEFGAPSGRREAELLNT